MHIISRKALVDFWESRKGDARVAERDLSTWFKIASRVDWANFADLKQTFGSADQVGHCVVFDVGNNRYRLVALVKFRAGRRGTLFVRKVMDHAEYDRRTWPAECGCLTSPPRKAKASSAPKGNPRNGRGKKER
ncbi:type II toxin-antitoxin system HigB family toxin [Aquisphaera insulae]|uniref:type II toxin-antitoxin system HigB family toxin n=1 Tax=Aquisphaera insulae TaxID=2712864 RepID=UPI0013EE086A|nr:type II toxin-antitoxin system HigB family toxin [Aquisphaera insulae]